MRSFKILSPVVSNENHRRYLLFGVNNFSETMPNNSAGDISAPYDQIDGGQFPEINLNFYPRVRITGAHVASGTKDPVWQTSGMKWIC